MKLEFKNIEYVCDLNEFDFVRYLPIYKLSDNNFLLMFCIQDTLPYKYFSFKISHITLLAIIKDRLTLRDTVKYRIGNMFEVTTADYDDFVFDKIETFNPGYLPAPGVYLELSDDEMKSVKESLEKLKINFNALNYDVRIDEAVSSYIITKSSNLSKTTWGFEKSFKYSVFNTSRILASITYKVLEQAFSFSNIKIKQDRYIREIVSKDGSFDQENQMTFEDQSDKHVIKPMEVNRAWI